VRVALDTNILAYAEGVNGAEKRQQALDLLQRLPDHAVIVRHDSNGQQHEVEVDLRKVMKFEAEDVRLHRLVAVKFLPDALARDPQALTRFQREARAASSLNHPNICTVHDI